MRLRLNLDSVGDGYASSQIVRILMECAQFFDYTIAAAAFLGNTSDGCGSRR